jgi:hypothetical protein
METKMTDSRIGEQMRVSCGCCTGDGSGDFRNGDYCVCHNHMDIPNGIRPRTCSMHSVDQQEVR